MTGLAENLHNGWADRADRAYADLRAAAAAPALFKPEWTERAQAELARAAAETSRWGVQAIADQRLSDPFFASAAGAPDAHVAGHASVAGDSSALANPGATS